MNTHTWRRPDATEAARGVLAVHQARHTLWHEGRWIPYVQECPYSIEALERRYKRGGDMPKFITVREKSERQEKAA
jgi:hypothetical protein